MRAGCYRRWSGIFTKFLGLDPEKQERILKAAIGEFALKGYRNASTNEIVKEAGISKGLLFHYFHSKKDLFFFLYDYALDFFTEEFFGKNDFAERDILLRLRQIALVKLDLIKRHPESYKFLLAANIEESGEVKGDLERRNRALLTASYDKMYGNFDVSRFKPGIDIRRAIRIMAWTWEGFGNQELDKLRLVAGREIDCHELLAETDRYLALFMQCFYK